MKIRKQIITTIFFIVYLLTVLLTDFSLTGFWTDVIFSILLSVFALRLGFKNETDNRFLTQVLRGSNIICSLIVFGLVVLNAINPYSLDTLKIRSFYFQSVDERLFNAYFKPVGAYSGGYGNFWITETPKYFPVVEQRVFWDRTVDHDFNDDLYDGEPIDNFEVVRDYINEEVINKHNVPK
ncbi:hypothetical protein [Hymenobacter canadensis]|uniref:DUF5673 domain-containing protein n=1 Tax=Hymenobacter canadensis TaxID=2999067 RepID=A0ABY7LTK0_9BACT|nr:hypothetical protein [Hymenobacter canadensis]WBA42811.1 hypothetical protein O3303_04440 [Hymenobacter canadensis]